MKNAVRIHERGTYEIGTYWNFKITEKFSYTFEPHYFMRVNDFNRWV